MAQRGGKRAGAGRRKQERPVDANVARKIKTRIQAEDKWVEIAEIAYAKAKKSSNTADLCRILMYLDARDLGNPVDTVNHLHDKALDVTVTHNLGEGMRLAMTKADERLARFKIVKP